MKKKKQVAVLFVLALMMVFSSTFVYGAEVKARELPSMRMVASGDLSLTRMADKKAELEVYCRSSVIADYIKATCTVQKLNTSTKKYVDFGETFEIKDTNTPVLSECRILTMSSSGTFRVKVVFEDKVNGITTRTNAYYTQAVGL
ncbi:hypothetical protein [Sinanaerobacter sp. ZZT-01]|uniref:hypothetical protein n=1 Tax=Sinanaerobacter sp. ZZT-01 TaxID=3111540 RepID=UPI002D791E65|nr:hypothetical protein [Sinanaerobacter sp. ZZT-01]WRR92460.1 hypothetical protein U5921_10375 [Sinanaerobacter sp. ZZT-01]